jgi:acetoin utilization protein AcuB
MRGNLKPKFLSEAHERWVASHWMSAHVHTVTPEDYLVDAFELMRVHRIRHLPVVDRGRLVGIISDRDVRHALPMRAERRDATDQDLYARVLLKTRIERVMTRNPITIEPDATIREAAEIICREKIGALPVLAGGELKGIISAEDLLWAFVENTKDIEE